MATSYVKYKLQFKQKANRLRNRFKEGVLLKNSEGRITDYMPWEEFGDISLSAMLELIKQNKTPSFIKKGWDTQWEAPTISRFQNHDFKSNGSNSVIKLKYLGDLDKLTTEIQNSSKKIRLDFNSGLTKTEFENWAEKLESTLKQKIDFVEDPYPGFSVSEFSGLSLAHDFESCDLQNMKIKIYKPLREDFQGGCRTIYTNVMGHPIGVLITHKIWESDTNADENEIHGMVMPDVYSGYPELFKKYEKFYLRDEVVVGNLINDLKGIEWQPLI